ncbi:aminodeoxychorismate synthase component I [Octadecabacter ascidiaceicola]|uniref:Aminodeoxychorismate synthase component 1 n=1 Tax=Octadecabacter ascidiaceicola TaxID=1655543 RepID=A0A238K8Z6_9RHOB|nr:aminodeoxychorismate synthase component I [Octadecabacter ascidiaceicola]SMX39275.1 Aminodeoxychorismate synthase component 1 [Octadecabacter ascidiaceicola]
MVFDKGPNGNGAEFSQPSDIIRADTPAEVDAAFAAMQKAQADGKWLAGYVSYEFGYLTSHKLEKLLPQDREVPLIHFGVFDEPQPLTAMENETPAKLNHLTPQWSAQQYAQAFGVVHDYIGAGDIYQVNLTFPITTRSATSSNALYAGLTQRQTVPHGALVDLDGVALLSRSPELFFSLSSTGELKTKPMKGTSPRGKTPAEDDALRDGLHASEKNRAENLMIVDLLRNDMSRVSEIGSVKVPELFAVERFATLHQMTSTITSKVIDGTNMKDLFMALFPCGSITGAPKVRAMEIISEVETQARGAYCGSIGWIAPDGAMEFSVAIRTLMYRADGTVQLNVGGGVVYDSTADDEYDEALLKAQFANLG